MVEANETTKQGPWLVKSGDRILGPYSTDDLSRLIREKEVVVIDEIMAPESRWTYVRDVKEFQPLVEEIRRGLMHSREDTEVQGYTSPVKGEPITRPPTSTQGTAPEAEPTAVTQSFVGVTPELGNQNQEKPAIAPAAPTPVSPVAPPTPAKTSKPAPAPAPPQPSASKLAMEPLPHHNREATKEMPQETAPLSSKQYVRPRMGGGRSSVVIGSLVLIIAAGFIIYSVLKSPQMNPSSSNSDNLQAQASVAWKRGEFDRALELYRALNHDQPGQPLIAARLATLLMKVDGQTVEAKRVIESAQANAKDEEQKSALAIAAGLAALQTDDAKQAVSEFSSAGSSWIASFDRGIALTLMKNWSEAAQAFQSSGENAVALLMLARTYLNEGESGATKIGARKQADDAIKKALVQAPDYQQESLLVAAYIDALSGDTKRASKEILDAVETDPNQTSDHFHDPGLNLDQVSWAKLLPYCESVNDELKSQVSGAMLGICLAKANQLEQASKLIEEQLGKESTNPYLHAVSAYLHTLADQDDAARAALTLSAKNGNSRLAQILSARLCMHEKQDACAEDGWSKLASDLNPPIAAITGLAQLHEQKGDSATANALLVKAESMSPTYLPLLRLREDASR